MRRPWTDEEVEILRKYYPLVGQKISIQEICEILERSQPSVYDKAQKMGIKTEYTSRIDYALLEQLEKRVKI